MPRQPEGKVFLTSQVAAYWLLAGGSPLDLPVALAIALAESSVSNAVNDSPGETPPGESGCASVGIWQINHCPGRETYPRADLLDPLFNARKAVGKRNSPRGWDHWTQYRNGAYLEYLDRSSVRSAINATVNASEEELRRTAEFGSESALGGVEGEFLPGIPDSAIPGLDTVTGWVEALGDLLGRLLDPGFWRRVGLILAGAALLILGAVLLIRDTDPDLTPGPQPSTTN